MNLSVLVPSQSYIPQNPNALKSVDRGQAAPDGPDLVIDLLEPSIAQPNRNDKVFFNVVVTNQGNKLAEPFDVRLQAAGVQQVKRSEKGLEPGASQAFTQMGPLTAWSQTEEVWLTADDRREVSEQNENNNKAHLTLRVKGGGSTGHPIQP